MPSCYRINADSISAYYTRGILVITAQGHCECPSNARIVPAPIPIEPPEFNLETCACPRIGMFPYSAQADIPMASPPPSIVVNTASGSKTVKVGIVPVENATSALPQAAEDEVVGYAPNSTDVDRAIADAVSKLRTKFPTGINATVTEIGFFAAGTPVGVAALFVKMKQQN